MKFDILTISVIIAINSALVAVLSVIFSWRKNKIHFDVREEDMPDKKIGMILLIGPSKRVAISAIDYHKQKLEICWLVGTEQAAPTAQYLVTHYPNIQFKFGNEYIVAEDEIKNTYEVVSFILANDSKKHHVKMKDIVADITGGLKTMTSGMVLACTGHKCDMQYMKSPRNERGEIVSTLAKPIKVGIAYNDKGRDNR
jgi:hypothetical protein